MRENRDNKNMFKRTTVENKEEIQEPVVEEIHLEEEVNLGTFPNKGCVIGCDMLNVRSKPDKESNIVSILQRGVEIEILDLNASDDFYKIVTEVGIEGYCMKDYIAIKAEV